MSAGAVHDLEEQLRRNQPAVFRQALKGVLEACPLRARRRTLERRISGISTTNQRGTSVGETVALAAHHRRRSASSHDNHDDNQRSA